MENAATNDADRPLTGRPGQAALDGWTTVRVAGKDRATFLHNMCTNDVRALADGEGCEAFVTDVKGKIIGYVFIFAGAEEHLLIAAPDRAAALIAHLDRYVIREDVQLADRSEAIAWTLIAGRGSAEVIDRLTGVGASALAAAWSHRETQIAGTPVQLVRCDLPWPGGFLAACPSEFCDQFRENLRTHGVTMCSDADWHALRIESGWPLEGVDFDGANLPEVGRDAQAINFRKGCYLGQETIARIDALGHVNKRLATVRFAGEAPIPTGADLQAAGQPAGRATSIAWSPTLGFTLGIAMLKRGFSEPGQRLSCGETPVEVISTPAVNHESQA